MFTSRLTGVNAYCYLLNLSSHASRHTVQWYPSQRPGGRGRVIRPTQTHVFRHQATGGQSRTLTLSAAIFQNPATPQQYEVYPYPYAPQQYYGYPPYPPSEYPYMDPMYLYGHLGVPPPHPYYPPPIFAPPVLPPMPPHVQGQGHMPLQPHYQFPASQPATIPMPPLTILNQGHYQVTQSVLPASNLPPMAINPFPLLKQLWLILHHNHNQKFQLQICKLPQLPHHQQFPYRVLPHNRVLSKQVLCHLHLRPQHRNHCNSLLLLLHLHHHLKAHCKLLQQHLCCPPPATNFWNQQIILFRICRWGSSSSTICVSLGPSCCDCDTHANYYRVEIIFKAYTIKYMLNCMSQSIDPIKQFNIMYIDIQTKFPSS